MTTKQKKIHQARTSFKGLSLKEKLIKHKGGKCIKCGYTKNLRGLSFHHRIPKEKLFSLTVTKIRIMKWEEVLKEAEKCDLLCLNCHAETEDFLAKKRFLESYRELVDPHLLDGPWSIVLMNVGRKRKEYLIEKEIECLNCHKKFKSKFQRKFCSHECGNFYSRKVQRPNKEELLSLINQKIPWTHLGKKYGVTDNCIKKWARRYNIYFESHRAKNQLMSRPGYAPG